MRMSGIDKLLDVIAQLRNPEGGCPWDLKQTHLSLRPYMLEEAYEAVEAMTSKDTGHLKEELGDVLLQVALHAQIAAQSEDPDKRFDFQDVAAGIADKLIRRHPHVFGEVNVSGAEEVTANWEEIKRREKGNEAVESIMDGVSENQPALSRALKTSKKAVKVGFEWPNLDSLWDCVMSEFTEFKKELDAPPAPDTQAKLEDEMGDIFFATVNLARHFNIDPEVALTRATTKFTRRFKTMETIIRDRHPGIPLEEAMKQLDFQTWDDLWNEAKKRAAKV